MLISHVNFAVRDLQKAIDFYEGVFGLAPKTSQGLNYAYFELGAFRLVLCGAEVLAREMGIGPSEALTLRSVVSHNVSNLADVDFVCDRAVRAGARVIQPPRQKEWGGTSCFFADLDGHVWEVVWNPRRT